MVVDLPACRVTWPAPPPAGALLLLLACGLTTPEPTEPKCDCCVPAWAELAAHTSTATGPVEDDLRVYTGDVWACYEVASREGPLPEGRLTVRLRRAGGATEVLHLEDTVGDAGLTACFRRAVDAWDFPRVGDGQLEAEWRLERE